MAEAQREGKETRDSRVSRDADSFKADSRGSHGADSRGAEPREVAQIRPTAITWEAEEYVQAEKNTGWYVGLIFVALVLILVAVLLKQWTFIAVVVVSVLALIVFSVRPPRKLKYKLDTQGLREGERKYLFRDFRAFGILNEGKHFAIVLTPKKRLGGRITVYFPEEQGEEIVDAFGVRLPMEEVKLDVVDRIVRFLRI